MVEQLPFKQLVPSSNLGRPMIIRKPQVYACGFFVFKFANRLSDYSDIASIFSIGFFAFSIVSAESSIFGSRFSKHASNFSGVLSCIFLQCKPACPDTVAEIKLLFGTSFRKRCIISIIVATMNLSLGFSRQNEIIFSVLQTQSAISRILFGHSGWQSNGASGNAFFSSRSSLASYLI